MNNNQMNFDPMTGQPLNNNIVQPNNTPVAPAPVEQIPVAQQSENNSQILNQQQMQNIPTVEQSKQQFIDNTQANFAGKVEEKK